MEDAIPELAVDPSIISNTESVLVTPSIVNVGVVSFVNLSVVDIPESEPDCKTTLVGAVGSDVSISSPDKLEDAEDKFPAGSRDNALTE